MGNLKKSINKCARNEYALNNPQKPPNFISHLTEDYDYKHLAFV